MAKFNEVSEDIQELFDKVLETTNIQDFIQFKVLNCETEKTPIKIVKPNEIANYILNGKIDLIAIVNETLLDEIGSDKPNSVNILIEEALCQVYFDNEKDKIVLNKPDYITFTGMINKYGKELNDTKELVKLLAQQKEDAAKEAKQAKLDKKKNKQ